MATRYFHWDVVDDCVMHETDEHGDTIVEYTREPGPFGPLLSENRGGTESYHHYDALGSTTFLTDAAGNVTDTFAYDACGNPVARTGTTPTPYTWVGRWGYQDDSATSGAYYVRARTYQPAVARWMSVDPAGFIRTEGVYLYGNNHAVFAIDPTGLIVFTSNMPRNEHSEWPKPCPAFDFTSLNKAHYVKWNRSPDEAQLFFSQLVTLSIEITTSCPTGDLDADICGTPGAANIDCRNNYYSYSAYWYEGVSSTDNQPWTIDKIVISRLLDLCPYSTCCNYAYQATVTKELTAKEGLIKKHTALMGDKEASYQCFNMDRRRPDPMPPIPDGFPEKRPKDKSLPHPHPYTHELWTSEKQIEVTHDKCGAATHTCRFYPYTKA